MSLSSRAWMLAISTLFLTTVAPVSPAAAAECALTAADFKSLQLSNSHIKTQAEVDALPEDKQKALCKTRMQWDQILSSGQLTDDDTVYWPHYLSPGERKAYGALEDASMQVLLGGMSQEEWNRRRQQILNGVKQ